MNSKQPMVAAHLRSLSSGIKDHILIYYLSISLLELMHVLLHRDGVSESQFNEVINNELDQIKKVPTLIFC